VFRVGEIEEGEQVLQGEKSDLVGKVVGGESVKEEAKLREGVWIVLGRKGSRGSRRGCGRCEESCCEQGKKR